jgi:hypothetical protein
MTPKAVRTLGLSAVGVGACILGWENPIVGTVAVAALLVFGIIAIFTIKGFKWEEQDLENGRTKEFELIRLPRKRSAEPDAPGAGQGTAEKPR